MINKPLSFNKELTVTGYTFYLNEQHRAYVPQTKEEFVPFINALFAIIKEKTEKQRINFALIKKYPFLLPKNRWDGGLNVDAPFNFTYNELDGMPDGWLFNFGEALVKELSMLLTNQNENAPYKYTITDVKEKYGTLRWYDSGATKEMYKAINEYEIKSASVCLICGQDGEINENTYWLEPLCPRHKKDRSVDKEGHNKKRVEVYKKLGEYNV